jgi:DNA polymerase-1
MVSRIARKIQPKIIQNTAWQYYSVPEKAFDVETTGLNTFQGHRIFSYAMAGLYCDDIQITSYRTGHPTDCAALQRVCDGRYALVAHNLKFELHMLAAEGIYPDTAILHDTMLMAKVLRNLWRDVGLDDLTYKLCGYKCEEDNIVKEMAAAYGGYHKVPAHVMRTYQRHDVRRTMILYRLFWPEIASNPALREDYENEIALVRVTQRMEERGMQLDYDGANSLLTEAGARATTAEDMLAEIAGEWFNPASDTQLARILFVKLKLPILKLTPAKLPKTDGAVIALLKEKYPHPILDQLITYRTYSKMCSTVRGYFKLVDSAGVAHPNIKTCYAANTREACEKPNLQNVSKIDALSGIDISERRCWRAREGFFLLMPDYAGIDMRLIILKTGDPIMMRILQDPDGDIHLPATELFYSGYLHPEGGIPIRKDKLPPALWKSYRSRGKNAHFAKPYSARLVKIASTLGISIEEATPGYTAYCMQHPKIAFFSEDVTKQVIEDNYSFVSFFGRLMRIPPSEVHATASYIISAGTAGIIKRAQVKVYAYLRKHGLLDRIFLIVPVHDEVIMEVHNTLRPELPQLTQELGTVMIDIPEIDIPLKVEFKQSNTTWEAATEYKIPKQKIITKVRRR